MVRNRRVTRREKIEERGKLETQRLIKPANRNQRDYIDSIKSNVVSIILGPSGVGKGLIGLSEGMKLVNSDNSDIDKIYYIRSNVGMSDELGIGFTPGSVKEKTMELAYPVLDNLIEFMSEGEARYVIEKGKIEVLTIGMIRGRSFRNKLIIVDEVQNATFHHIVAVLTRIGEGSKMILMGDIKQCDLKDKKKSGILEVTERIRDVKGVGVVEFTREDIMRHPIIRDILDRL